MNQTQCFRTTGPLPEIVVLNRIKIKISFVFMLYGDTSQCFLKRLSLMVICQLDNLSKLIIFDLSTVYSIID